MKAENKARRKPYQALGLGLGALLLMGGAWRLTHPALDEATRDITEDGYDADTYPTIMHLLGKADQGRPLTRAEWNQLKTIYASPSTSQRTRRSTMGIMMELGHSPYRDEILRLVRPQLQNPDWVMQNGAIILLRHFKTPDWASEAARRVNSPDENIRSNAQLQFQLADAS